MEENIVVKTIENTAEEKFDFISGTVENVGTDACQLTPNYGSVYGFAVRLKDEKEKEEVFKKSKTDTLKEINEWKPLPEKDDKCFPGYYPLYWGEGFIYRG